MTETETAPKQDSPGNGNGRRTDVVAALFRFQSLFGLVAVFVVAVAFSRSGLTSRTMSASGMSAWSRTSRTWWCVPAANSANGRSPR